MWSGLLVVVARRRRVLDRREDDDGEEERLKAYGSLAKSECASVDDETPRENMLPWCPVIVFFLAFLVDPRYIIVGKWNGENG